MGLDSVELILDIEKAFEIAITNEEAATLLTVGDIQSLLRQKRGVRAGTRADDAQWMRLRAVIIESRSVPIDLIVPEAEITRDLGID